MTDEHDDQADELRALLDGLSPEARRRVAAAWAAAQRQRHDHARESQSSREDHP